MIVCLGWGSLIWDPRTLPMDGPWASDGPAIPVDFSRQSGDGRLTLVVDSEHAPVGSLWTVLSCTTVRQAVEALRVREGIASNRVEWVGCWEAGEAEPSAIPGLPDWAAARGVRAAVWTALPSRFRGRNGEKPSPREAVAYLRGLTGHAMGRAREYVQMAPRQVDTLIRRRVEADLGWYPNAGPKLR